MKPTRKLLSNKEGIVFGRPEIERDLVIARQIQAGFLPEALPALPGWEIASCFQAARQVAGDFYDAFDLAGGKRVGLVVGDVCGKGVSAALFMALFRSLVRAFADQHYSLGWIDLLGDSGQEAQAESRLHRRRDLLTPGATPLKKAIDLTNDYIAIHHGKSNMFATLFFGVLDPVTGALNYINGGHEPPLLIGSNGIKASLSPTGPAVGLFAGVEFSIAQVMMEPGDTLLVYTDGVLDTQNAAGAMFGEDRLQDLVKGPVASAEAFLDAIHDSLRIFMAGADQFDDITLLAVRRRAT